MMVFYPLSKGCVSMLTMNNYSNGLRSVFFLFSLIGVTACSSLHKQPTVKHPDHPLAGKIYKAEGVVRVSLTELLDTMSKSDVIYLGENHDNTYHHKIQLDVIKALVEKGVRPAIGFEFFSRHQTSHLINHQNAKGSDHGSHAKGEAGKLLRLQLGWESNRDQDWQRLYSILQYARENKLPVFGADLSAGMRKQISRVGYSGLSPVEKLLAPASDFKDENYREFMHKSFVRSHCGWGDDAYLARLYDAWLSRNEAMAQSIVATHEGVPGQPVVMILGGGHTQFNMAVYERVEHLQADIRQINIRLQEVVAESIEPDEYLQSLEINNQNYGLPYEYVWYTPSMPDRIDPCLEFNKQKEKLHKKE